MLAHNMLIFLLLKIFKFAFLNYKHLHTKLTHLNVGFFRILMSCKHHRIQIEKNQRFVISLYLAINRKSNASFQPIQIFYPCSVVLHSLKYNIYTLISINFKHFMEELLIFNVLIFLYCHLFNNIYFVNIILILFYRDCLPTVMIYMLIRQMELKWMQLPNLMNYK